MPSLHATLAILLAATTASAAPSITFQNASPHDICYGAELSSGTFPSTTTCGPPSSPTSGITVPAGATTTVPLPASFNGALTAWTTGPAGGGGGGGGPPRTRGARYELNFAASATSTWYDADYQLGMSDGTLGPRDHRPLLLLNGRRPSSLTGEPDTLAKANAAWPHADDRAALLAYPDYIRADEGGRTLTFVYCDADAPQVVVHFFQVTAAFEAYVDAGSVAGVGVGVGGDPAGGGGVDAQAVRMADVKSLEVGTQEMLIVAY